MSEKKKTFPILLILYRTAAIYTVLDLTITALYFAVIVPMMNVSIADLLLGGIKISHRAAMLLIAFVIACIWGLLSRRKVKNTTPTSISHYIYTAALTYTLQIAVISCVHGLYLVTYYNEYVGISSPILRGPSFILSFAAIIFALAFPFLQRLLHAKKLPTLPKCALHCIGIMLLVYLTYFLFADAFARASSFLILCAVFTATYILFAALYFHLHAAKKQNENENSDYTPLYQAKVPKPDKVGAKPKQDK